MKLLAEELLKNYLTKHVAQPEEAAAKIAVSILRLEQNDPDDEEIDIDDPEELKKLLVEPEEKQ